MDSSETQDLIEKPASAPAPGIAAETSKDHEKLSRPLRIILEPFQWIAMLCRELNASFVFGIVLVYGLSQGFSGSFFRVVSDYYWKDVQKVQPSAVQMFVGFYYIPWVMKPVWGVLTDVIPVRGYRRRPYFIVSGILGAIAALIVSSVTGLPVVLALLCFVGVTTSVAIADVTIDACIARNSIEKPHLAPDMQSLCGAAASLGALFGFSASGVFVRDLGAQGALGIMAVPAVLLVLLGFVIYELRMNHHSEKQKVWEKVDVVVRGMGRTIRYPAVWKPSLYMFLSLALSISTHEGQFYWYTNPTAGPAFSQKWTRRVSGFGFLSNPGGGGVRGFDFPIRCHPIPVPPRSICSRLRHRDCHSLRNPKGLLSAKSTFDSSCAL